MATAHVCALSITWALLLTLVLFSVMKLVALVCRTNHTAGKLAQALLSGGGGGGGGGGGRGGGRGGDGGGVATTAEGACSEDRANCTLTRAVARSDAGSDSGSASDAETLTETGSAIAWSAGDTEEDTVWQAGMTVVGGGVGEDVQDAQGAFAHEGRAAPVDSGGGPEHVDASCTPDGAVGVGGEAEGLSQRKGLVSGVRE
jgi:hypothetical protein